MFDVPGPPPVKDDAPTREQWLAILGSARSTTLQPGYWDLLAENSNQWAKEVSISPFWEAAKTELPKWSAEFYARTGGPLLPTLGLPSFVGKGAEGIRSKSHRNSLSAYRKKKISDWAGLWPQSGPSVPDINDLVRVRIETSYLDGVQFLADKLERLASNKSVPCKAAPQGKLEGYFAYHLYFKHAFLFRVLGEGDKIQIECEIQIATTLSTRVWDVSHGGYELWREEPGSAADWQWNPKDPRFIARQLGHMIHLADGLLVQLRDAITKEKVKEP